MTLVVTEAAADAGAVGRRRAAALAGHGVVPGGGSPEAGARAFLGDPDPGVRATALGALQRLGALRPADLDRAATDPSPVVRARVAELAAGFPELVPMLVAALGDDQPAVVEAACFGLGEMGAGAGGAVASLGAVATGHGDPICREAAVAALGAIGAPAGLAPVLAATADKPAVRRRAVVALAAFDGPEVDEALQRARSDRDWQVRQAAEDLATS